MTHEDNETFHFFGRTETTEERDQTHNGRCNNQHVNGAREQIRSQQFSHETAINQCPNTQTEQDSSTNLK